MADAGLRQPAFLSLDVEGAELKVVETFDPATFSVIMVEMDSSNRTKDAAVHSRLLAAGLKQLAGANRAANWYVPF